MGKFSPGGPGHTCVSIPVEFIKNADFQVLSPEISNHSARWGLTPCGSDAAGIYSPGGPSWFLGWKPGSRALGLALPRLPHPQLLEATLAIALPGALGLV